MLVMDIERRLTEDSQQGLLDVLDLGLAIGLEFDVFGRGAGSFWHGGGRGRRWRRMEVGGCRR
jgi:hypothetical protein